MLKIAVFAPMPSAIVRTAIEAKARILREDSECIANPPSSVSKPSPHSHTNGLFPHDPSKNQPAGRREQILPAVQLIGGRPRQHARPQIHMP